MCGETSRMDGEWRDNIYVEKRKEMRRGAVFGKDREVEARTVRNEKVETPSLHILHIPLESMNMAFRTSRSLTALRASSRSTVTRTAPRVWGAAASRVLIRGNATATLTPRQIQPLQEEGSLKAHYGMYLLKYNTLVETNISVPGPRPKITHDIADLSPSLVDQKVVIAGWLFSQRQVSNPYETLIWRCN